MNTATTQYCHVRFGSLVGRIVGLGVLSAILSCNATPQAGRDNVNQSQSDSRLDAILWQTTSAEYKVLARSIYANALVSLERALRDSRWNALPVDNQDPRQLPPAVILDIDETVIDTGSFQGQLAHRQARFSSRPWRAWQERNQPSAVPGAVEFIAAAQAHGVTIFYITNRDHATKPTIQRNLAAIGVTLPEGLDTVLCRGERPDWSSDKESRRRFIAQSYRVLLLIGDDLADFISDYRGAPEQRTAAALRRSEWGTKWFLLPNPMYGSWEGSLYGFRANMPADELTRQKLDKLPKEK